MANVNTAYGTANQLVTCTLTSLASSATVGRESLAISNTTTLFLDVLVSMKLALTTGTAAAPNTALLYCAASVDGGTSYPDAVTGADASITINSPTQLKLLGVLYMPTQSLTYKGGPWSIASLYGGKMPATWSLVVINTSGIALTATAGNHVISYQGVFATVT